MRRFTYPIALALTSLLALHLALWPRQVHSAYDGGLGENTAASAIMLAHARGAYRNPTEYNPLSWGHSTARMALHGDGDLPRDVPAGGRHGQTLPMQVTSPAGTLSGTVCDAETGDPLAGSVVVGGLSVTADENGYYTLRQVGIGTLLTAAMSGYETGTATFSGQGVQDFLLLPAKLIVEVCDLWSGQPLPNASVASTSISVTTDAQGAAMTKGLPDESVVSISATGYEARQLVHDGSEMVRIGLRPNTLQGIIRDGSDGHPIAGALVAVLSTGEVITSSITAADGVYTFSDLPWPIRLVVAAVDYDRAEVPVGTVTQVDVELEPFVVRGIYVPLGLLTSEERVRQLIDLVDRTELNALVVDVKNDRGWLAYPSGLAEAQQSKAYKSELMSIVAFLSLCRERGIYTIARLVVFKDSALAAAYPEWAVRSANDELWRDSEGSAWGDPFRVEVQDYNISIAREVATLGFDELQFDYLRFPSDGALDEVRYAEESTLESRTSTIRDFCARLRSELEPHAVLLSADLFGLTVWVSPEEDMGIGQRVVDIAPYMDYVSPMLYPATFVSGNLGYKEPLLHPYEVVYRSCVKLRERMESQALYSPDSGRIFAPPVPTRVRPWLQHYSASGIPYGVDEMRLQKAAATDGRALGWMFWNAAGRYDERVFDLVNSSE